MAKAVKKVNGRKPRARRPPPPPSTGPLTPAETLAAVGHVCFGPDYKARLADTIKISLKSLQRMLRDDTAISTTVPLSSIQNQLRATLKAKASEVARMQMRLERYPVDLEK